MIFLLIQWIAEEVYHKSHYEYNEVAYLLEIDEEIVEVEKEVIAHSYANMTVLKQEMNKDDYNKVRLALGLEILK